MKSSKKRHLFAELQEGFEALKSSREDKITLKTHEVEDLPPRDPPGAKRPERAGSCVRGALAKRE